MCQIASEWVISLISVNLRNIVSTAYLLANQRANRIKALVDDRIGFWLTAIHKPARICAPKANVQPNAVIVDDLDNGTP